VQDESGPEIPAVGDLEITIGATAALLCVPGHGLLLEALTLKEWLYVAEPRLEVVPHEDSPKKCR